VEDVLNIIHPLGRDAAQRNTAYRILKTFPQP
jgi:hypothetical protein